MDTIGGGIELRVTCTIGVNSYVGGRRNRILRFGPEGDGVRRDRIFVDPFHCVAHMNCDNWIVEPHHRERVQAGACGYYLAATNGHTILRMLVLRLRGIAIGQQGSALRLRQTIVELLVVGQGVGTEREHAQCQSCPRGLAKPA